MTHEEAKSEPARYQMLESRQSTLEAEKQTHISCAVQTTRHPVLPAGMKERESLVTLTHSFSNEMFGEILDFEIVSNRIIWWVTMSHLLLKPLGASSSDYVPVKVLYISLSY